ncbi:uncharacterized protein LOC129985078 [Argiope bruennichi]|uniref:uncharacterized protein LOC129985078 n=1 Tax=Argiope bruennichi TaxID=94029 RepID=UPI0024947065|nr:uncharacterized protein LOC129985078 [Argiope bruennichi]
MSILCVLSYIFRFSKNVRNPLGRTTGPLSNSELKKAENFLVKAIQHQEFAADNQNLQLKGLVCPNSKLKSLNSILVDDGILRDGGRLENLNFVSKHSAILPKGYKFSMIILEYYHKKHLHVGASNLLCIVLSGRTICCKVIHQCIPCFKSKPIVSSQLMGSLPKDRVLADFPFNCTGVDLCGPFLIKYNNQRKSTLHKVYVCVFVCFVTKATHFEILSDSTSECFIALLKRFIAWRGKCANYTLTLQQILRVPVR